MASPLHRIEWPPEVDAVLGQASDVELGRALGLDRKTVGLRRRLLNIRPYRAPRTLHKGICEVCGSSFQIHGRSSRLRRSCPPKRPGLGVSDCQRELISRQLLARQASTPSLKKIRRTPGMRFIGFDAS